MLLNGRTFEFGLRGSVVRTFSSPTIDALCGEMGRVAVKSGSSGDYIAYHGEERSILDVKAMVRSTRVKPYRREMRAVDGCVSVIHMKSSRAFFAYSGDSRSFGLRSARFLLLLLFSAIHGFVLGACPDMFSGEFLVADWPEASPGSGRLERYKKGSDFRMLEDRQEEGLVMERVVSESGKGFLRVYFKTRQLLPLKADYKLVLDGQLEFRTSEIVATNEGAWGCPLESARVNSCKADANVVISFDRQCGVPARK